MHKVNALVVASSSFAVGGLDKAAKGVVEVWTYSEIDSSINES